MAEPLSVTHPELMPLWDTENNTLDISTITKGSTKKAWWKCEHGHSWEANVSSIVRGTRCPYCSGRKAIPGINDIATLHPHLVNQWHPDNTVALNTLRPGSQEIGIWTCAKGHTWTTKVRNRVNGAGCHVCLGKAVQQGFNDLTTTHPQVALLWDYSKNDYKPTEINAGSEKQVHFICAQGHQWNRPLRHQTETASGCPYCAGRKAITGENDLATSHPQLGLQWHPTLNQDLLPTMVTAGMDKKVWWLGNCGHEWDSFIHTRTKQKQGCPYCSGTRVLQGYNDLQTLKPELASEWHPTLNGDKTPAMVSRGSNYRAWWICGKEHFWLAKVADRSILGSGCPNCAAGRSISVDEQELCDFLRSHGFIVEQSNRDVLKGMELDMLIKDHNLAIEFNGLYWHSENQGKDKTYHYNKWFNAKKAGIQLLQIWEDEWKNNKEQVKTMLLHKLGINDSMRIYARKTRVDVVSLEDARNFLATNHIQGFAAGSYYYGLYADNSLHAVIILKKEAGNRLNIVRYATNATVVGGFTKLIAYIERTLKPTAMVTFSDHCVSDGSLYANNGFTIESEISPDYRYVIGMKRHHKFGFRLKKFRDDPSLLWQDGMTERELATLNGIDRIWDAGKTKWIKKCTNP